MDADLRVGWTDWNIIKHLNNVSWKDPLTGESIGNFTLDSEFLQAIWKPDIFMYLFHSNSGIYLLFHLFVLNYRDEMASAQKTSLLSNTVTLSFSRIGGSDDINYKAGMVYSAR